MQRMALRSLSSIRPISLNDWPAFQRDHISRFCSAVKAGLSGYATGPPPDRPCIHHHVASIGRTRRSFRSARAGSRESTNRAASTGSPFGTGLPLRCCGALTTVANQADR